MDYVNFDLQGFLLLTIIYLIGFAVVCYCLKPENNREVTQNGTENQTE